MIARDVSPAQLAFAVLLTIVGIIGAVMYADALASPLYYEGSRAYRVAGLSAMFVHIIGAIGLLTLIMRDDRRGDEGWFTLLVTAICVAPIVFVNFLGLLRGAWVWIV